MEGFENKMVKCEQSLYKNSILTREIIYLLLAHEFSVSNQY